MTMQHLARPMAIFLSALAWCVAAIAAEPLPLAGPPWGVMAGDGDAIPAGIVKRAQDLGLPWFRPPAVLLPRWRPDVRCKPCGPLRASGLRLALTVRNAAADDQPATPPADLEAYDHVLDSIVEAYRPALLAVENEEHSSTMYYDGVTRGFWHMAGRGADTATSYGRQLAAACAVAHRHHIPCTDGGLSSEFAAVLTWADHLRNGRTAQACAFARLAFTSAREPDGGSRACDIPDLAHAPPRLRLMVETVGDLLIPVYRASPMDYLSLHWYIRDPEALNDTVAYLRRATGKPVLLAELGLWRWEDTPRAIIPLGLAVRQLGLPLAIWSARDTPLSAGIMDPDGALRPSGDALDRFLKINMNARP